jgi:hypothetical protein
MRMNSLRLTTIALALVGSFAATACEGDCTGVGAPAVRVTVLDFSTQARIAQGATLSLFRSNGSIPIQVVTGQLDSDLLSAGIDETGRFDVLVEKLGYSPWRIADVEVSGACTVQTVSLTAQLRHLPPAA